MFLNTGCPGVMLVSSGQVAWNGRAVLILKDIADKLTTVAMADFYNTSSHRPQQLQSMRYTFFINWYTLVNIVSTDDLVTATKCYQWCCVIDVIPNIMYVKLGRLIWIYKLIILYLLPSVHQLTHRWQVQFTDAWHQNAKLLKIHFWVRMIHFCKDLIAISVSKDTYTSCLSSMSDVHIQFKNMYGQLCMNQLWKTKFDS